MIQSATLRAVKYALSQILSDILVAASQTDLAGVLNAVYVGLYTGGGPWAMDKTLADLTEPTYGGYARVLIVWGDKGLDGNDRPEVVAGSLQFQPTDASVSDVIAGAFIADASSGGNLIAMGDLPSTVTLQDPTSLLTLIPRFVIPGILNPDWGEIAGVS